MQRRKTNGAKIGNKPNHFKAFKRYFKSPNVFLKKQKCNLGDYEFHVDPYGKLFFCCYVDSFGNMKVDAVPTVWNEEKTKKIRERVYACKKNCHIMINCFYEDEKEKSTSFLNWFTRRLSENRKPTAEK